MRSKEKKDFVLARGDIGIPEIIEAAKENGWKMDAKYVYGVRARSKRRPQASNDNGASVGDESLVADIAVEAEAVRSHFDRIMERLVDKRKQIERAQETLRRLSEELDSVLQ